VGTAANVNDVTQAHHLLHGKETDVFGDAGDQGVDKREENRENQGRGFAKEAEIDRFLPLMTTSPPPAAPSLGSPPVQQRSRRTGGVYSAVPLRKSG